MNIKTVISILTFVMVLGGTVLWTDSKPSIESVINEPNLQAYAEEHQRPLADVARQFAATGILRCGRQTFAAQLAFRRDRVVTAARYFRSREDCSTLVRPESCRFSVVNDGKTQTVAVRQVRSQGFNCPIQPKPSQDWMVLDLDSDIDQVEPYAVPLVSSVIAPGTPITLVSEHLSEARTTYRRYTDCAIRKAYSRRDGHPYYFSSDCLSSQDSFGGAAFRQAGGGGPLELIGILDGGSLEDRQLASSEPSIWSAYNVPIAGELLEAILN